MALAICRLLKNKWSLQQVSYGSNEPRAYWYLSVQYKLFSLAEFFFCNLNWSHLPGVWILMKNDCMLLISASVYTGVDFCKKLCGVSIVRRLVWREYISYLLSESWQLEFVWDELAGCMCVCDKILDRLRGKMRYVDQELRRQFSFLMVVLNLIQWWKHGKRVACMLQRDKNREDSDSPWGR